MRIDFPTLFMTTGFITEVAGLLLLFSWFQDRRSPLLAYWGAAYSLGAIGGLLFTARGFLPHFISVNIGGAMTLLAFGLMWCGARSFEGRRPEPVLASVGAGIWFALATAGLFETHVYPRIVTASLVMCVYLILTIREFWHARDKELMSRWPVMVLLATQVMFMAIRIVFADHLPFPGGTGHIQPGWIPVGIFALMLNNFCMAFLVMSMTKERLEREQRHIALIDSLTGVANRRAFFERGERILQRADFDNMPAALLLFDLDLFKQINDTFGHQAGDRVLCDFCDVADAALRPSDMLGRIGGEEFACLLPGASATEALQIADRIRTRFAGLSSTGEGRAVATTVSVGIAMAMDSGYALDGLLAAADRGLYQAKAKGRNRTERVRPGIPAPDVASAVA